MDDEVQALLSVFGEEIQQDFDSWIDQIEQS